MKEIKRYDIHPVHWYEGSLSLDIYEDKLGEWCKYSDVEQLQARIKELESEAHINEIKAKGIDEAIDYATDLSGYYDTGLDDLLRMRDYAERLRGKHD